MLSAKTCEPFARQSTLARPSRSVNPVDISRTVKNKDLGTARTLRANKSKTKVRTHGPFGWFVYGVLTDSVFAEDLLEDPQETAVFLFVLLVVLLLVV